MGKQRVNLLMEKGVDIAAPATIQVGDEINSDRISGQKVTIHAGCKLFGDKTLICDGAELGYEGAVTLKNCYVGPDVKLKGGFFENAVFLQQAEAGSGSHVRGGTILEEQASIAHTVGLKQTILFPYVTLGSLINFCDCLMAGGTNRKNHSEVGSSYIHFNYTPNQDKATPSLIGDVVHGVMLNQPPIFLGGQGGVVGPCRLAYGTIVAAGSICRKDVMEKNHLVIEGPPRSCRVPFKTGSFYHLHRQIGHNLNYIGNLYALKQWYRVIRNMFVGRRFPEPLLEGLNETLASGIAERIKQLKRLKDRVQTNLSAGTAGVKERAFCEKWDAIEDALKEAQVFQGDGAAMDQFCEMVHKQIQQTGKEYLICIKSLAPEQIEIGIAWLQSIVDHLTHHPSVQTL
jgi:bifunctional UDP-N-acetylglucosamine pyrophosphorylase / glucosamine-1-phosphate N-acetyltransferase